MRKHRLRLRRDFPLPRLGRSRYIPHDITSFHCLVSVGPGTYVTILRHCTASSRSVPVHTSRYYVISLPRLGRSRYIRHDITSFHCLVSVGPGTYVTILRHFTASSRSVPVHTSWYYVISLPRLGRSRYIRHDITSFHCLVSVGPGTYVMILRHFTASSRSVPVHTSWYYVISLPRLGRSRYIRHDITSFHCLVSVGPGAYVTILRHFTASSRSVPVHTSRYYVISLPRLGRSRYIRHDITSFHCLVSVGPGTYVTILRHFTASSRSAPVHTSRYYVISLPRLGRSRYIRHDITSFHCLVSVGPGTYVTILRHFTASSRSVPVHTSRYYVISRRAILRCAVENLDMSFKLHIFTYYQDIVQTPSKGSLIVYNVPRGLWNVCIEWHFIFNCTHFTT